MKQLSDRRQSAREQIAHYRNQARLARMGLVTRRTPEFFDRQVAYFEQELR